MTIKKWIAGGVSMVLVIGAGALFLKPSTIESHVNSAVHTLTRGDMLISVTESGQLRALNETPINCEVDGQNRITFMIDEATVVKKGDLLMALDSAALKSRINRQEIEFQSASSSYSQSKENLEIRKSLSASEITAATLSLTFAKLELNKFQEGQWPLEVKKQKSKIALAKDELIRADDRLTWTRQLQTKGYATRSELESDTLSVKRKQLEIEQEQEQLKLMEKYDYPQKLEKLKADVEKSGQELERVKRKAKAELSQSMADLQAKDANMKNHESELTMMKSQLRKMKILAPQDGLVVYHRNRYSEDLQVGGHC